MDTSPQNKFFGVQEFLHGFVWNSESLDYNELQNVFPKDVKAENFGEGTEESKVLSSFLDE